MRVRLSLLLLLSLSLFLSGCSFDESLEGNQQHDGDDMNVIQNIWPQALDQVLRWLPVPVVTQKPTVTTIPSYSPSFVEQKKASQPSVVEVSESIPSSPPADVQPSVEPTTPSLVWEPVREWNDGRQWEDD